MFLILTYDEFDSQSSAKAWQVWYPHLKDGFATCAEAEDRIAQNGARGEWYHIVEVTRPVTPQRTVAASLLEEK